MNSDEMEAMVAYFAYISQGVPIGAEREWAGTSNMKSVPIPDVAHGEELYAQSCIACHAADGSGTGANTGPALWGENSFNDGAGMARLSKMAGYIQNNMPIGAGGTLTDQDASDLAAYILAQDRPEWANHDKDWPKGGRPNDIMDKEKRDQVKTTRLIGSKYFLQIKTKGCCDLAASFRLIEVIGCNNFVSIC